jgi:stearoyl-CoA desaturase (Delta-9 desaturase)
MNSLDVEVEPEMNLKGSAQLTVRSSYLEVPRLVHATLILVLPTLGVFVAIWLLFHGGVTRLDVCLFAVMYCISFIGITVGYHRYFTHVSFKTSSLVKVILGTAGSTACQGPVNYWVSNHRRHHRFTDKEGDIHSPHYLNGQQLKGLRGFWHSHIGWTFVHEISNTAVAAPDLLRDRTTKWVNDTYYVWVAASFLVPTVIGGAVSHSWRGALTGLIWGGLVRLFVTYHSIHTITSLAHLWGKKEFRDDNQSRNNIWLSIFTWGESWHNNHHTFPGSAMFGLKWWQVDLGGYVIRGMQALRLVWGVRVPSNSVIENRLLKPKQ